MVNPDSMETGVKGLYAGGDVTQKARAVIFAIAAGRQAAASIDRALGGSGAIDEVLFARDQPDSLRARQTANIKYPMPDAQF